MLCALGLLIRTVCNGTALDVYLRDCVAYMVHRGIISESFANWTVLQKLDITGTKMRATALNTAGNNLPSFLALSDRYSRLLTAML